jgi:hypothetical protein
MRFSALAIVALVAAASAPLRATTVIAPTFEDLVRGADLVFEAEVIDARARLVRTADGDAIVTDVDFRVAKTLKGSASSVQRLEFLGGTVGDVTYRIDGLPSFARGDRDVLFAITSSRQVSPLVAMMYGRVRIAPDDRTKQDVVRLFDGTPLGDLATFGSRHAPASASQPMSLAAFENAIASEVARQRASRR